MDRQAPCQLRATLNSPAADTPDQKNPFLVALGDRLRGLRARRGVTRKALAQSAGVSERHLANLEGGVGNASILVLLDIAQALQCSLTEIIGDFTTASPEGLMIREMLEHQDEATLGRVRRAIGVVLGRSGETSARIALIGLRGAGKSTLGRMLAEDLGFAFVELSREIERLAGCSLSEIQALYGMTAYRRYERRDVDELVPRGVHHEHARLREAEPPGVEQGRAVSRWRAVERDHVARGQKIVDRQKRQVGRVFCEGVVPHHVHAEAAGEVGDDPADLAAPHDAKRFSLELDSLAALPAASLDGGVGKRDRPREGEDQADRQLRDAPGIRSLRPAHVDAAAAGRVEIDRIDAGAVAGDYAQV